jgi:hypothetical protein
MVITTHFQVKQSPGSKALRLAPCRPYSVRWESKRCTGSGQGDYQGKPAGLLNKPGEGHWECVQKLVRELRTLSPVIMAPACASKLSISPADAPVEYSLRELQGTLYLLAANKSVRPQTVRFSGSALSGKRAQVLQEAHPAGVQSDSLSDEFTPLGVHVYKLE